DAALLPHPRHRHRRVEATGEGQADPLADGQLGEDATHVRSSCGVRLARPLSVSARRAPPTPSAATHSIVSSPATVPSNPGRPDRSSADATTWAHPGGGRTATRFPEGAPPATHSPTPPRRRSP